MMMNKPILALLAGAAVFALVLPSQAADSAQEFVNKATIGGLFEVDSSRLADTAGSSDAVKEFASLMVKDHGAANAKLATIAGEQKLAVPMALDEKHQAVLEQLKADTTTFDQSYVKVQTDAHSDAVTLFQAYSQSGDNEALKAFAAETLPTLKMHQQRVEKLASSQTNSTSPSNQASPPVPGANSFTETQAKTRIEEAGYSQVSALSKDSDGIWRGSAMKDGKSVGVALDYQGNVVVQDKQ
jgi:putative membrane protein